MDSCINHLRQIDAAKQQWALKNNKTNGPVTWNDVLPYMGRNTRKAMPLCPQGGTYILGNIGDLPKCSSGGDHHTLPE